MTGRITPELYDFLASGYEQEQFQLKSKLSELESPINSVNFSTKSPKSIQGLVKTIL